jgi:hypothetical protein
VQLPDPALLAAAPSPWSRRGRAAAAASAAANAAAGMAGDEPAIARDGDSGDATDAPESAGDDPNGADATR